MKFSIFALAALVLLVSSVSGAKIGAYHANFVGLATYAPNSTFDNFISETSNYIWIDFTSSTPNQDFVLFSFASSGRYATLSEFINGTTPPTPDENNPEDQWSSFNDASARVFSTNNAGNYRLYVAVTPNTPSVAIWLDDDINVNLNDFEVESLGSGWDCDYDNFGSFFEFTMPEPEEGSASGVTVAMPNQSGSLQIKTGQYSGVQSDACSLSPLADDVLINNEGVRFYRLSAGWYTFMFGSSSDIYVLDTEWWPAYKMTCSDEGDEGCSDLNMCVTCHESCEADCNNEVAQFLCDARRGCKGYSPIAGAASLTVAAVSLLLPAALAALFL